MQPPVRAEPPSPREAQLAQRLVALGLLSTEQARSLWQRRMQGDARPLEQVLVQDRLVAPEQVQRAILSLAPTVISGAPSGPAAPPGQPPPEEARHPTLELPGSRRLQRPGTDRFPSGPGSGEARPPTVRDPPSSASGHRAGGVGSDPADLAPALTSSLRMKPGGVIPLSADLQVTCERLLGQGGMGTVHLVHDPALGRRAALKLVKGEGNETRAKRFRREVVVTARLDHPGIPPVFLSGRTATGQDYLLMRFVDGRSLEAILDQVHGRGEGGRFLPGAKPAPEQRDLLDALVKVSEAVAYAHSRGIVHRDLKPANIMIGAFGEVLLMDWGLARDLSESSQEDAAVRNELATMLEDTKGLTQDGALLGTPGYMSPEQARGHDVDARADVYALGALLVEVLTGEPPVVGQTALELLAKTGQGEIVLPRQRRPDLAPELDAIAGKALATDPAARYDGAAELGADLKAYLEGRTVSVYRYGPIEQLRRLARRHPAALAALGVTFVLSLVTVVAVAQARSGAAAGERAAAIARARGEAQTAWKGFEAGRGADVDATIGLALAALQAAQRWRVLAPTSEEAAREQHRSAVALGELAEKAEQWSLAVEAFKQAGGLGIDDAGAARAVARVEGARNAEAERRRREVEALLEQARTGELARRAEGLQDAVFRIARYPDPATISLLRAQLDRVSADLEKVVRDAYLEVATPDEAERRAGERELEGVAVVLDAWIEAGLRRDLGAGMLERLSQAERRMERRTDRARGSGRAKALILLASRQAERVSHGELDVARLACEALGRMGDAGAVVSLARYLAAERDVLRAIPPAAALLRIGGDEGQRLVMAARARFGRGSAFIYRVDEMLSRLDAGAGPKLEEETAQEYFRRGDWFEARRDFESARAAFTRAIELDPGMAEAYSRRGNMRIDADPRGALADYDKAISLVSKEPRYFANRANARTRLDDPAGAIADFDRALELDPDNSGMFMNRGLAHEQSGDMKSAFADYDKAISLDPANVHAYINRGVARQKVGDLEAARADLDHAVANDPREVACWLARALLRQKLRELELAQADLDQAISVAPNDTRGWELRADVRMDRGDLAGALSDATRAIALDGTAARAWKMRSDVKAALRDPAGALADVEQAMKLDPSWKSLKAVRAELLAEVDPSRARAEADEALASGSADARAWIARGKARAAGGEFAEAAEDFRRAVELAPTDAGAWASLGGSLGRAGDLQGALAAFDEALRLSPDRIDVLHDRGLTKRQLRDPQGALRDFSRVIELDATAANAWAQRSAVRMGLDDDAGARADALRAVELAPDDGQVWFQLGVLKTRAHDWNGALADAIRATDLSPEVAEPWELRAFARDMLGETGAAAQDAERALELDEDLPLCWFLRAKNALRLREAAKSAEYASRALSLAEHPPAALIMRAGALEMLGDFPAACRDLEAFIRLAPPDLPEARQAQERLARLRGRQ